jgi:hypothetical protein
MLLRSDIQKRLIIECSLSLYRGKEYLSAYVRDIVYDSASGKDIQNYIFCNNIRALKNENHTQPYITKCNTDELNKLIDEKLKEDSYGVCLIASEIEILKNYNVNLGTDIFYPSLRNLANTVLISPASDADLSGFKYIIYLDIPPVFDNNSVCDIMEGRSFINSEICGYNQFLNLETSREYLLEIYSMLRTHNIFGDDSVSAAENCGGMGYDTKQLIFALEVFYELGIISYENSKVTIVRGRKVNLNSSLIYTKIISLIG